MITPLQKQLLPQLSYIKEVVVVDKKNRKKLLLSKRGKKERKTDQRPKSFQLVLISLQITSAPWKPAQMFPNIVTSAITYNATDKTNTKHAHISL